MLIYFTNFFAVIALMALSTSAAAEASEGKDAYAVYLENDSKNIGGPGSDQSYSNGFKFSYIYAEGRVPRWATPMLDRFHVLENQAKWAQVNFALSLGHQIFTPNNTQASELLKEDRPYAAWLYLGFAISLKEKYTEHFIDVDLGTIGPSAQGKQLQNGFHGLIGTNKAHGWRNGLRDEPTLQLFYQKRHKVVSQKNLDFVSYYGSSLGNVLIGGHVGGTARVGIHLPDDFGSSRPSASDGNSFISSRSRYSDSENTYYLFGGVRGNYVNTNIFLDGNSYQESHSVKKLPFTFESEFGFGLRYRSATLVWRFVSKSPELVEKKEFNSFASVSLVYVP